MWPAIPLSKGFMTPLEQLCFHVGKEPTSKSRSPVAPALVVGLVDQECGRCESCTSRSCMIETVSSHLPMIRSIYRRMGRSVSLTFKRSTSG